MKQSLYTQTKLAFTMVELVFAIVVVGILAAVAIPRLDRDHTQDAAVQILQDIRYTQHLAVMDDKTNPTNIVNINWQRAFWTIRFDQAAGNWRYGIVSDDGLNGAINPGEWAIDPVNGDSFFSFNNVEDAGESTRIFLTNNFGINNVDFAVGCTVITGSGVADGVRHIAFDYMGRPHKGIAGATNNYSTIMQEDCNITFTMDD